MVGSRSCTSAADLARALEGASGGVARLARGGLFVRFLAASAPELEGVKARLWAVARRALFDAPLPGLRKY